MEKECIKHHMTADDVKYLIKYIYSFTPDQVKPLVSYDDQNFLLSFGDYPRSCSDLKDKRLILKILKTERSLLSCVQQQFAVLMFLRSNNYPCSALKPSLAGNCLVFREFESDNQDTSFLPYELACIVLLSYIPGVMLSDLDPVPDHIFKEAGLHLAKMHLLFTEFPGETESLKQFSDQNVWSLHRVPEALEYISVVKDADLRGKIRSSIEKFSRRVLPNIHELPKGVIHGDFNDDNIIVHQTSSNASSSLESTELLHTPINSDETCEHHIAGIIDFCEVSFSCLVFDVAMAISYMMINNLQHPVETGRIFLTGYNTLKSLTFLEEELLLDCVKARLAQGIILSLKDFQENPTNEYHLAGMEEYCDVIMTLSKLDENLVNKCWFSEKDS